MIRVEGTDGAIYYIGNVAHDIFTMQMNSYIPMEWLLYQALVWYEIDERIVLSELRKWS